MGGGGAVPLRLVGRERGEILNDSAAMRQLAQQVGKLIVGSVVLVERGGIGRLSVFRWN